MAKMKSYAIDVVIPVKMTLYVEARRPNGAQDKLMTEEGWREAFRYHDDLDLSFVNRSEVEVVKIREAGF